MASGLAGQWKDCAEQSEGFEEFMLAHGYTKDIIEKWKNIPATMENVQEGDKWTTAVKAGEYNQKISWQFGKSHETKDIVGNPATITPRVEGDSIIEEIVSKYKTPTGENKEKRFTQKITITGDSMKRVITDSENRSMTQMWIRVK